MIELPPFDGWLLVAYGSLHMALRHMWVIMVNRLPVSVLPVAALALAAFWLWAMFRAMPAIRMVLAMWR